MEIDRELILQTFIVESGEHLSEMEEALLLLEAQPQDVETLQTIFRVVHTIKGSAACLGLRKLTDFAHVLEDLLDRLRNRTLTATSSLIKVLLTTLDVIRQMTADAAAGNDQMKPWQTAVLNQILDYDPDESGELEGAVSDSENKTKAATRVPKSGAQTLRIGLDKLDHMLTLTGEIAIAQGRLRQLLEQQSGKGAKEVLETHEQVSQLYMDLQELVMKSRMEAVGPTFRDYTRTVRDVANTQGKVARLVVEGEEVEVDTKIIELLKDPLTHLIRNALDHGIERPEVRRAQGKDPCGLITLRTRHDAGTIVIELHDDGAGLNRNRILDRARSRGLNSKQEMTDQEVYRLVFEPGFSTAELVTDLSGRGVGLDVVRRNIEMLRGSVSIDSQEGNGTTLNIRLPLTLAIIEGFSVGVGQETYVIPMENVVECLELNEDDGALHDVSGVLSLRGEPLPYLRLREMFELGGSAPARQNVLVVHCRGLRAGIVVDVLHGKQQTVIKPLGHLFKHLDGVSGSAILGTGRVALVLDVQAVLESVLKKETTSRAA